MIVYLWGDPLTAVVAAVSTDRDRPAHLDPADVLLDVADVADNLALTWPTGAATKEQEELCRSTATN